MGGGSSNPLPSLQDITGIRPIANPILGPAGPSGDVVNKAPLGQIRDNEAVARQKERDALKTQITNSQDLDFMVRKELLNLFTDAQKTNQDIASQFQAAIDPNGGIFKEYTAKKARIQTLSDTPGINNQTLLSGGIAAKQNDNLILPSGSR